MCSITDFQKKKEKGQKLTMVTCYDYWTARLIARSNIDAVLVGDSAAMVMHGHDTTLPASSEMMAWHTQMVAKGIGKKLVVGDMPFLSFRKGLKNAMETVEILMQNGAGAVKLEGVLGHEDIVEHIVKSGVPVMGHLGLTPQSIHQLGGYKIQAKSDLAAEQLLGHARRLYELGCFSIVLECIPERVSSMVQEAVPIPIIGIGAGKQVDGQILVLQDLLGMNSDFSPKFVRKYLEGERLLVNALNHYCEDVVTENFPSTEESF